MGLSVEFSRKFSSCYYVRLAMGLQTVCAPFPSSSQKWTLKTQREPGVRVGHSPLEDIPVQRNSCTPSSRNTSYTPQSLNYSEQAHRTFTDETEDHLSASVLHPLPPLQRNLPSEMFHGKTNPAPHLFSVHGAVMWNMSKRFISKVKGRAGVHNDQRSSHRGGKFRTTWETESYLSDSYMAALD